MKWLDVKLTICQVGCVHRREKHPGGCFESRISYFASMSRRRRWNENEKVIWPGLRVNFKTDLISFCLIDGAGRGKKSLVYNIV